MNSTRQSPLRLDHGVSDRRPVAIQIDTWPRTGPGQYDMHFEVEIGIVRKGAMRRECGDSSTEYGRGDVWFNGIWEPHATHILEAPLELVVFHVYPPMLAQVSFPEMPQADWLSFFTAPPQFRPRPKQTEVWLEYARRAQHLWGDKSDLRRIQQRQLLMEALVTAAEEWPDFGKHGSSESYNCEHLNQAINMVFASRLHIPVQKAAEAVQLNRNLFARRFRERMGVSFQEFSLRYRLSSAAQELVGSSTPIKAISKRWGFTDKSHFHRHFRKIYGITPAQYRKRRDIC